MAYDSNWFQSVEQTPLKTAPPFSKTLQVDRVAPGSPGSNLGLKMGDKLLSVNGKPALTTNIPELLAASSSVVYRFFLPRESALLDVTSQGLPLGIVTSASSDGIVDQYKSRATFENEGLLTLWERGDYQHIRKACALANKRLNIGNVLGKLMGKGKTFPLADMMLAICDIEDGKAGPGYEALGRYTAEHSSGQTSDVNAVATYYHALNAKAEKQTDEYRRLIANAYRSFPQSDAIVKEAVSAGVEINPADRRIGRVIPTSQTWNVLQGGQGSRSLEEILASLGPNQILPLCLMTSYRGNGPYNDDLLPYIALYPHIRGRLHPLVVLTNVAEKRPDRPHWNANEGLAKKMNCPFTVLHGSFDEIIETFSPRGAPEFFAIDRDAKIIWAGDLATDFAYWEMLDKVGASWRSSN